MHPPPCSHLHPLRRACTPRTEHLYGGWLGSMAQPWYRVRGRKRERPRMAIPVVESMAPCHSMRGVKGV